MSDTASVCVTAPDLEVEVGQVTERVHEIGRTESKRVTTNIHCVCARTI